eukprot:TRINITY_DN100747_c0_g1_i1.p1 TRINITY_DN100747_c0_g1~~TRINITY_DN100747_c0_g1_i1.p1  ORF type:complete len:229 (-),score=38.00 TRINITY_DN100747_c0_g1_i1:86-772(-)
MHAMGSLRVAAAAAGAYVVLALIPASPPSGAFAEPSALNRLRPVGSQFSGTVRSQPLGPLGLADAADEAAGTSVSQTRTRFGRVRSFFGVASKIGAVVALAAVAALPSRRRRDGKPRQRLQGLATGLAASMPAGFQAFANSNAGLMLRLTSLNFCKIYMAMLVLRITIMWFPNINPYRQPFYSMIQLTDPYLNLFRGWMPPIFGIDLSVILAFVVIQAVIDALTISPF